MAGFEIADASSVHMLQTCFATAMAKINSPSLVHTMGGFLAHPGGFFGTHHSPPLLHLIILLLDHQNLLVRGHITIIPPSPQDRGL